MADSDFVTFLRSKSALGRLNDAEVQSVLAFLEGIGFAHAAPAAAAGQQAPIDMTPAGQQAAQVAQVMPPAPSALANLESIIEKDVKEFFEPAPIAPPPQ